jgi:hypothetical protein
MSFTRGNRGMSIYACAKDAEGVKKSCRYIPSVSLLRPRFGIALAIIQKQLFAVESIGKIIGWIVIWRFYTL